MNKEQILNIKTTEDECGHIVNFSINDNPVGIARTATYSREDDFLHGFEVYPKHRGKGYGYAILQYMLNNYPIEWLNVGKDNLIAIRMYKKFGFSIVGEVRVGVYDEVMWQMKKII